MDPAPPGPGMPTSPGPPPPAPPAAPPLGGPPAPPKLPPPPGVAAGSAEPPVPHDLKNLWAWAKGYIRQFRWSLAPVWLPVDAVHGGTPEEMRGCCCKEGEACMNWGKHLVSGLGVAHQEADVELVWPASDVRVRSGFIGIAVLTGSESHIVVLDVGEQAAMTRARFKITGHVLTQATPSGGQHWFFRIGEEEAVTGGRTEIELVTGVWVLGDGAFAVLPPRRGYSWVGGSKVLRDSATLTETSDALRLRLTNEGLIKGKADVHQDAPWRTRPGTPLVGGAPRTYTRRGDVRRLVDKHGDRMLYTPGLGWRVWTEGGWGGTERSETTLRSYVMDLPDVHLTEAAVLKARGDTDTGAKALKWSKATQQRATSAIFNELATDERVLVPSAKDWDAEGWIAGLPVTAGVGRLVDLRTGEIVLDARTRRVSRSLGADYDDGPGNDLKRLWDVGADGGPGKYLVKYLSDLETSMGSEWLRLLQRAAGASLYGRRGVDGDTDAVFVLKGPTRSGKSTFAEMLLAVAGSYGKAMPSNLLFGDRGDPGFSDAALFGFRVMTLSEPPQNAPLNQTKLKQLSGGDSITGRLPYGREEISFQPECSLWLSTNHALEISDEAVWRRLKIFGFDHSWEEGHGDLPELRTAVTSDPDELRLAFNWMLQGATDWATSGWGDTEVWRETVLMEKAKHDPIARWVADCLTVTGVVADTFTHGDLLTNFDFWLMASAEIKPTLSRSALRDELEGAVIRAGVRLDRARRCLVGGKLT